MTFLHKSRNYIIFSRTAGSITLYLATGASYYLGWMMVDVAFIHITSGRELLLTCALLPTLAAGIVTYISGENSYLH